MQTKNSNESVNVLMFKYWVMHTCNSKSKTDVVTRKHMMTGGQIFQVADLNRTLTQFRPSEINYLRDLTE